jgi:hypothetical protein
MIKAKAVLATKKPSMKVITWKIQNLIKKHGHEKVATMLFGSQVSDLDKKITTLRGRVKLLNQTKFN